jgi:hypothetical protein
MPTVYFIWALILLVAAPAAAQSGTPQSGATAYNIFLRGSSIGREDVSVATGSDGTTITVTGRMGPPVNAITRKAEFKYSADWTATSFTLDGTVAGGNVTISSMLSGGKATTTGTQAGTAVNASHDVDPKTFVLPNGIFGGFTAVSRRLAVEAAPGAEFHAYILPVLEIPLRVNSVNAERMQSGTTTFNIRRYELTFMNPGGGLAINMIAGEDGNLIRLTIPAQGLDIIREDVAASTSRTQIYSNPGDEALIIPALGFNLGATITKPQKPAGPKIPAVILLAGSNIGDRDGVVFGVPILAQLAGALADAGFLAVRYDKRGFGQSGGRAESATLADYAEDVRAIVKWLGSRRRCRSEADCGGRPQRRGHGGADGGSPGKEDQRRRLGGWTSVDRFGTGARAAAACARTKQCAGCRACGQGRAAEADCLGRDQRRRMAGHLARAAASGRYPVVPEPAHVRSCQGSRRCAAADVDRPWRARSAGASGARGQTGESGAHGEQVEVSRRGSRAWRQPSARSSGHGRNVGVRILKERTVSKDVTGAITGWLSKTFQAVK